MYVFLDVHVRGLFDLLLTQFSSAPVIFNLIPLERLTTDCLYGCDGIVIDFTVKSRWIPSALNYQRHCQR